MLLSASKGKPLYFSITDDMSLQTNKKWENTRYKKPCPPKWAVVWVIRHTDKGIDRYIDR